MTATKQAPALGKDLIGQIREHGYDIEARAGDIEILLQSMIDKIDSSGDRMEGINAIDCFVRCAQHQLEALRDHQVNIMRLTLVKGGV